jgi:hypothetical protein
MNTFSSGKKIVGIFEGQALPSQSGSPFQNVCVSAKERGIIHGKIEERDIYPITRIAGLHSA